MMKILKTEWKLKTKGLSNSITELFTTDNGRQTRCDMEKEFRYELMGASTKDTGDKTKRMAKGGSYTLMEMSMKVNEWKTKRMV